MFLRTSWWSDGDLDPEAVQQAHQGRGKITRVGSTDEARVPIQRNGLGQAVNVDRVDDRLEGRLRREVLAWLSSDEDRGADIDGSEDFNDVLLFALGVGGHRGDILEVELPGGHAGGPLNGGGPPLAGHSTTPILAQDLPDGARGARQAQAERLQLRILAQERQDGFRPGDALQVGGRLVADLQNAVNHARVKRGWRVFPGAGAPVEDGVVVERGAPQPPAPFLDPAAGAANGLRDVADGPLRVGPQQSPQGRTIR
jgi:hypothetical protein